MSDFLEGNPARTPQTRGVPPWGRPRKASRVRPFLGARPAVIQ